MQVRGECGVLLLTNIFFVVFLFGVVYYSSMNCHRVLDLFATCPDKFIVIPFITTAVELVIGAK